jgi:hypothetical protein
MGVVTYAITWQQSDGTRHSGRLELGHEGLHLQGGNGDVRANRTLPYSAIESFRPARAAGDRLQGRPTLVLELDDGTTVRIAGVAQSGIVAELSDRLAARTGARHSTDRAVIVVPLREGAREEAEALIRRGPPFDPSEVGLGRHGVYLTESEAVFVFEGDASLFGHYLAGPGVFVQAMAAWRPLIEGRARYGDPVYTWSPTPEST